MMASLTDQQRNQCNRILFVGGVYAAALLLSVPDAVRLGIYFVAYVCAGWPVFMEAVQNLRQGEILDENFLMGIASLGAMALGEYAEGVAVMLFYQVGEFFESYAVGRSRESISALMDIVPQYANVYDETGTLVKVEPAQVEPGTTIIVKPGERIPLDGIVLEGASSLDTSALTGEPLPQPVHIGDEVSSGCINQTGMLSLRVLRPASESVVTRILELVESASEKKAHTENFITRFARYYTPVVVGAAVFLAIVPPLAFGAAFADWLQRALIFLVISCPCALVISVPLSFFGGIGGASRRGILIKGSNYLEMLARTDTVVFDKTGTLTRGHFVVTEIRAVNGNLRELLELAAMAESYSNHPIAQSVLEAYGQEIDHQRLQQAEEIPGYGVQVILDGGTLLVGSQALMQKKGIFIEENCQQAMIHVAFDGQYKGGLFLEDEIREDAQAAVEGLRTVGVRKTVMLTGDRQQTAESVAERLLIDEVHAELLPGDKVSALENLLARQKGRVAFVGDGINDAPVLARADVGIAMGGLGSDAAIEAADIVLMTDEPSKLVLAIRIARQTLSVVWQNIIFALGVKAVVMLLGALGLASMWGAIFADTGVAVLAILNSFRPLVSRNM